MRGRTPFLLLMCALVVLAWWWPNRLQNPAGGGGAAKLNSLSYDPYRPGESPLTDHFATAAEVEQDFTLLAPVTRAVRTYAAFDGPYDIAAIAQRHGVRVWQGVWLGGNRARNADEMARAIDLAHRYPDTIERVVVGNEVLLRRDLPVAELIADIDHVRAAVHQPVAYGDVPEFWDEFPQIVQHVDVVLIHLLPFWEDVPTGIGRAVAEVGAVYDHFAARFPGAKIAIGETCWPSRGRQRRDAVPGRVNETRFLRDFIALAAEKHFDYNFIEAFDQDWKYQNEGVVGANWGILTADRQPKIPLSGALREDPLWARHAAISLVCGLVLAWVGRRSPKARAAAVLAMILGAALGVAWATTIPVLYDAHASLAAVVNLGGQALLAVLAMRRLAGAIPPAPWRTAADATARVAAGLRLRRYPWAGLFEDICFVFAWTAAVEQMLLVFDPRYRDFPLPSFAVPLVVVVARAMQGDGFAGKAGRGEVCLALVLTGGAVASAVQEGWLNGQSLAWNACVLVLAAPFWRQVWAGRAGRWASRAGRPEEAVQG